MRTLAFGDIHGVSAALDTLLAFVKPTPEDQLVFLGDYVDRGKQSLETICLLLAYKIKYPENFFILRGNHECASINRIYGFYDECKRRYNIKIWKTFIDCFKRVGMDAFKAAANSARLADKHEDLHALPKTSGYAKDAQEA